MSQRPARSPLRRALLGLSGLVLAWGLYHRWGPKPADQAAPPSAPAPAQGPPVTDHPLEVVNPNLLDLAIHPDGETIIVVGTEGSLFRSDDGGARFTRVTIPTREALVRALVERQRQSILVIGSGGMLLLSHDRGRTFAPVPTGTSQNLTAMAQAATGTIVVVGDQGAALSSTDAGEHFTLEDTHRPRLLNELVALPKLPGAFAAAGEMASVVVRDGSGRWIPADAPSHTFVTALASTADGALLAGLANGLVVRSTDHGVHWQETFGGRDQNYVMGFASSSDGAVVLARLRNRALARSQDRGRNFSLLEIPVAQVPTVLTWLEGHGFVGVADDGGLVRSDLQGKAWTHTPPAEPMRVSKLAVNPRTGHVMAVGPSGFIGRLAPGAARFEIVAPDRGGLIRALVQAPNTGTIVGVGLDATIVRSSDGGVFERVRTTLAPATELKALAYDGTHSAFVAASSAGVVYRSRDDGKTFHKMVELGAEILHLAWLGEGRILALCAKHGARLSHDGGKSFGAPLLGMADTFRYAAPGCIPGSVLVVGDNGTLLRSTGGTADFERIATPVMSTLRFFTCEPRTQSTWVVGDQGTLLQAEPLPRFRSVPLPTQENLFTLGFSEDGAVLFVGGNAGTLLRSTDRGQSFTPVPTGSPQPVRITQFIPEVGEFVIAGVAGLLMLTTQRTIPQRLSGRFEGRFDHLLYHANTRSIIVAGDRLLRLPTP